MHLTPDQAPSAMRTSSAPSIGIRIFLASARLNPVGRASTNVLCDAYDRIRPPTLGCPAAVQNASEGSPR